MNSFFYIFFFIKQITIVKISPRIVGFYNEIFVVQNSKTVDNVGAQVGIYVFWQVFTSSLTVPGPVREIAYNLEISCKKDEQRLKIYLFSKRVQR